MRSRFIFLLAGALAWAAPAVAQQPGAVAGNDTGQKIIELNSAQRSRIAEGLISRWMGQVMKSPRGDVKSWSSKLRKVVATADAANVFRADAMPSLDLVHNALIGAPIDDAAVKAAMTGSTSASAPQSLGSESYDTTYTPLPNGRCRVASSFAIASPLTAGVVREIDVEEVIDYGFQGGVGTVLNGDGSDNCGIPIFATAIAVSVSARNPVTNGVLKVFPTNRSNAAGNTIFFSTAALGAGSDLIVESCRFCINEIAILSTAQTDYIIDVIGYFMPPEATALQCISGPSLSPEVPAGATSTFAPAACPTGYTSIVAQCFSSPLMPLIGVSSNSCSVRNGDTVSRSYTANRLCCRVPGR